MNWVWSRWHTNNCHSYYWNIDTKFNGIDENRLNHLRICRWCFVLPLSSDDDCISTFNVKILESWCDKLTTRNWSTKWMEMSCCHSKRKSNEHEIPHVQFSYRKPQMAPHLNRLCQNDQMVDESVKLETFHIGRSLLCDVMLKFHSFVA